MFNIIEDLGKIEFISDPNLIRAKKHYQHMIIEVKVASNDEHLVEQVRQEIPFTPRRFSKYCESLIPQNDIYLF